jgi:hypothetical protein
VTELVHDLGLLASLGQVEHAWTLRWESWHLWKSSQQNGSLQANAGPELEAISTVKPALRSIRPFCTSIAQRTASTTLRNSMMLPSPVRLTIRP